MTVSINTSLKGTNMLTMNLLKKIMNTLLIHSIMSCITHQISTNFKLAVLGRLSLTLTKSAVMHSRDVKLTVTAASKYVVWREGQFQFLVK